MPLDTAEYMLGDVQVSVVFMESNGGVDANTENWTPSSIASTKAKITEGLTWWEDTLASLYPAHAGDLNFSVNFTYADNPLATSYEPITRPSDAFETWIYDFLDVVGYNQTRDFNKDIKAFNDAQRVATGADWAYTIFVVNDAKDLDKQFHPSGSFDRAFAFSGGRFLVSLASRPASTYAHETGHIFWAKDEYLGGASYSERRGYYNTPNTNAADNPAPGFRQTDSIMMSGAALDRAYASHTSAVSTLEMIGWRDSDGDGILDVVDVPLTLEGLGSFDPETGFYSFRGRSSVQTLPNLNSDPNSLKNDITINEVSVAEYRIDGQEWQVAATFGTPQADLNLSIGPLAAGAHTIEVRTRDSRTNVVSPVFTGTTDHAEPAAWSGIAGIVWSDSNADGIFGNQESGLAGWTVQLVNTSGQPLELRRQLDPDDYAAGASLTNALPGISLSAVGSVVGNASVTARVDSVVPTGTKVFSNANIQNSWTATRQLRIDLAEGQTMISIDAIGNGPATDYGRLDAYDVNNNLIARYTTGGLTQGQSATMTISRPQADIRYVLAYGHLNSGVLLDRLRVGPETSATTDANGVYRFADIAAGNYTVRVTPPGGNWSITNAESSQSSAVVALGQAADVDFGAVAQVATWQNPKNPLDVSNDDVVAPIDALLIINAIEVTGGGILEPPAEGESPPPYLDVNGDGFLSPIDALMVINAINASSQGEYSGTSASLTGPTRGSSPTFDGSGVPEGETARAAPWNYAADAVFAAWTADDSDHVHHHHDDGDESDHDHDHTAHDNGVNAEAIRRSMLASASRVRSTGLASTSPLRRLFARRIDSNDHVGTETPTDSGASDL